jgi:hypothetical protein
MIQRLDREPLGSLMPKKHDVLEILKRDELLAVAVGSRQGVQARRKGP